MTIAKLSKTEVNSLNKLIEDFDASSAALAQGIEDILADWQGEFDERSESWQSGEIGNAAQERIDLLQSIFDDLPETPIIDFEALS